MVLDNFPEDLGRQQLLLRLNIAMFPALAVALARDRAPIFALSSQLSGCEHELLELLWDLLIDRLAKLRCEVEFTLVRTYLVVIFHLLIA